MTRPHDQNPHVADSLLQIKQLASSQLTGQGHLQMLQKHHLLSSLQQSKYGPSRLHLKHHMSDKESMQTVCPSDLAQRPCCCLSAPMSIS